jgi:acylphosphatase
MPVKRVRIRVDGLVQGVGFRYFIWRHARELGLRGFVKNMVDGSVLIVAEGEEDAVEKLIELARRGPPAAIVEGIEVVYEEPRGDFTRFFIDYD